MASVCDGEFLVPELQYCLVCVTFCAFAQFMRPKKKLYDTFSKVSEEEAEHLLLVQYHQDTFLHIDKRIESDHKKHLCFLGLSSKIYFVTCFTIHCNESLVLLYYTRTK